MLSSLHCYFFYLWPSGIITSPALWLFRRLGFLQVVTSSNTWTFIPNFMQNGQKLAAGLLTGLHTKFSIAIFLTLGLKIRRKNSARPKKIHGTQHSIICTLELQSQTYEKLLPMQKCDYFENYVVMTQTWIAFTQFISINYISICAKAIQ